MIKRKSNLRDHFRSELVKIQMENRKLLHRVRMNEAQQAALKRREVPACASAAKESEKLRWNICIRFVLAVSKALHGTSYSFKDLNGINISMLNNCIKGNYPAYQLAYDRIKISRGTIEPLMSPSVSYVNRESIGILKWLPPLDDFVSTYSLTKGDKLYMLIYNETENTACFLPDIVIQDEPEIIFNQTIFTDRKDKVHCWIYGKKRGSDFLSESMSVKVVFTI